MPVDAQLLAHQAHRARHQRVVSTPNNYYSGGAFVPELSDHKTGAAFTATYSRSKAILFSYIEGQDMNEIARPGGTGQHRATSSDTNLAGAGGSTIGGDELEIFGVSLQLLPQCTVPEAVAKIWSNACCTFVYNGKAIGFQVGPPFFIPGQSSLYGQGVNKALPASAGEGSVGSDALYSFMSNGAPVIDNFMRIPEGLVWTSAGRPDSNMTFVVELTRDVTLNVPASIAADDSPVVLGWDNPASADLMAVEFMVKLHAKVNSDRSRNR